MRGHVQVLMNNERDPGPQTDPDDSWAGQFTGCRGCLLDVALVIVIVILVAIIPAYWVLALGVLAFCLFAAAAIYAERRGAPDTRPRAPLGLRGTITACALAVLLWVGLLALLISSTAGPERDTWMLVVAVLVTMAVTILTFWDMAIRRREIREQIRG